MPRDLNIAVINELRPPSHLAHAINIVKTAGGFARLGHRVTVLCRAPETRDAGLSAAPAYGEPRLAWEFAPAETEGSPERFARWAAARAASLGARLAYARHFQAGLACADRGLCTVIETHAHIGDPNPALDAAIAATSRPHLPIAALVTISTRLAAHYASRGGDPSRIAVVPGGVDLDLFRRPAAGLPPSPFPHRPAVLYAGHLYEYKGIPTILGAAAMLPALSFHLLGGLPEDVERTRARIEGLALANVHLHSPVPHAQVPRWLWHAHCLLLPPSAGHPSARWTSPVKFGEYLASGRPIVASAIPALRDWVDEPAVEWFAPDDPFDLARAAAAAVAETPRHGIARAAAAAGLAQRFSYPNRARAILGAARLAAPEVCSAAMAS